MHQIEFLTFDKDMDKKQISTYCDNRARTEENDYTGGLPYAIEWKENRTPFDSYDDAYEYLEENYCDGNYEQVAVLYRDLNTVKETKRVKDLKNRIRDLHNKYQLLNSKIHYKDVKSALISCKKCNSKINKDYLNSNFCPIFHTDLRPDSTKQRLENMQKNIKNLQKELQKEKLKQKDKAKIKWLVKIEYHC